MKKNSCGTFNRNCRYRPHTASPRYKILQWDADAGKWTVIRDIKSERTDANGNYKTEWNREGGNNIDLDGYIAVVVRKKYSDDKYRLTADSFRFRWQGLILEDREIAIEFCKAGRLSEVIQSRSIIAYFDFAEAVSRSILAISFSYFVGLGLANLPTTLANVINGIHAIKNATQLATVAKQISDGIRVIQESTRYIDLLSNGLTFATEVSELTDALVEAGTLAEHSGLYSKYQGWSKYPHGTVTDWNTGDYDAIFGKG